MSRSRGLHRPPGNRCAYGAEGRQAWWLSSCVHPRHAKARAFIRTCTHLPGRTPSTHHNQPTHLCQDGEDLGQLNRLAAAEKQAARVGQAARHPVRSGLQGSPQRRVWHAAGPLRKHNLPIQAQLLPQDGALRMQRRRRGGETRGGGDIERRGRCQRLGST